MKYQRLFPITEVEAFQWKGGLDGLPKWFTTNETNYGLSKNKERLIWVNNVGGVYSIGESDYLELYMGVIIPWGADTFENAFIVPQPFSSMP
jgi:hypothetical protein